MCQAWERCTGNTCEAPCTGIATSSHLNGAHVKTGGQCAYCSAAGARGGKTESGKAPVILKMTAPGRLTEHAFIVDSRGIDIEAP